MSFLIKMVKKMFNKYFRAPLKKILSSSLHALEKAENTKTIREENKSIWSKEINLPPALVAFLCVFVFFVVLLFGVGFSVTKVAALVILLTLIVSFIVFYLYADNKEFLADADGVMLLGFLFIVAALLMQLFKNWNASLATPIAGFAVLFGLLLSRRIALLSAALLSIVMGIINSFSMEFFLISIFGSLAGIVFVGKIRARNDITKLGIKIALVNVAAITSIHMFFIWPIRTYEMNCLWGAIGGFASAIMVLAFLPYLESFFSKTTKIKLLELADFNQPLLRRLMLEAPGTYHHSLMVASIAEQAAEAIGANSLLARVGAYYHDIGKLAKPEYFIENANVSQNPHNSLSAAMSSLVIISHVKDGVALAQKHKIDKVIIDLIVAHHGTSLVRYFYHKALEQNEEVNPENFRYKGVKPQTKVAAILMLADSVEAASRSLEDYSPGKLKDIVETIINNKFTDGQFSQCPITLQDLDKISQSMLASLSGIYHTRISYENEER